MVRSFFSNSFSCVSSSNFSWLIFSWSSRLLSESLSFTASVLAAWISIPMLFGFLLLAVSSRSLHFFSSWASRFLSSLALSSCNFRSFASDRVCFWSTSPSVRSRWFSLNHATFSESSRLSASKLATYFRVSSLSFSSSLSLSPTTNSVSYNYFSARAFSSRILAIWALNWFAWIDKSRLASSFWPWMAFTFW